MPGTKTDAYENPLQRDVFAAYISMSWGVDFGSFWLVQQSNDLASGVDKSVAM